MSSNPSPSETTPLPPCIVDTGIVPNKQDIQRLLADLDRVRYLRIQNGQPTRQGEGYVQEVFADPQRATLVANRTLYLNVLSFDYLELHQSPEGEAYFDLVRGDCQLRLIPLSNPLEEPGDRSLDASALEAVVADVLSTNWDVQSDDGEHLSF
jgi:hypothetical protein